MAASIAQVLSQMQGWASDAVLLQRYVHQRDEAAFAALVARHGAMVLRLCRRVLGDVHEAEDAFQAAFLILARKAHSLKQPDALPAWLYGVARRVALKARGQSNRRRSSAAPLDEALPDPRPDPLAQLNARELLDILDDEVRRLPAEQRSAFVLCCLEGRTQEEAARLLGWTPGSVKGRLERGRQRLQTRLKRRGIALSAALALIEVSRGIAVSASLRSSAVRAALGGGIGTPAATLAASVLKGMFLPKLAGVMALVMTAALAASATVALVYGEPSAEVPEDKGPALAIEANQPQTPGQRTDRHHRARPAVTPEAERAIRTDDSVAAGLQWFVQQQQRDGRWRMGSGFQHDDTAATALALLPLLEAGESPKNSSALHPYGRAVERGLRFLVRAQDTDGYFGGSMYSHALATRAVCAAYRLTEEAAIKKSAQRAIDLIVKVQDEKGGWRYAPMKQPGDTSVTSYQILALVAARRAGLKVPDKTLSDAGVFLDSVASPNGDAYRYLPGIDGFSPTMTAAGHLCRLALGGKAEDKRLARWSATASKESLPKDKNHLYYYYYVTEALHRRGGTDWDSWESKIRTYLLDRQDQGKDRPADRGSWSASGSPLGAAAGRLLMTSLASLMLQTCARTDKLPPWPARRLRGQELEDLYAALGDKDFVAARRALRTLAAAPEDSVPFLRRVLRPAPPLDAPRVKRLIAELDDDSFAVRQRATTELKKLAERAHPALRRALTAKPTLEARLRIEEVLEATDLDIDTGLQRQAARAVEVLVQAGTTEAHRLLETLAAGAAGARLTEQAKAALQRLARQR